jgi:tripartite-type tricarboxylate transporter receptor subunit TctC
MKKIVTFCAFIIATITAFNAWAWEPTKPVNVVIAYGPGSGNEILFRKLDTIINKTNKINFVLDFKPGAFELIGMNHFSQAQADGHTLYAPGVGVYYGTPVWFKKQLVQDPGEWEPVVNLGESPIVLFARTDSQVNSPAEFMTALRNGSKIDIGVGAPVFVLAYEHMTRQAEAKNAQRIQYNSPAAVANAVAAKDIEFGLTPLSIAVELAKAGKLKIIGVTGSNKSQYANLSDQFKGLDLVAHVGLMLPKGTPQPVVNYYKKLFSDATNSQEYRDFLTSINWYDSQRTPDNYRSFFNNQRKKWIPVAETIEFK